MRTPTLRPLVAAASLAALAACGGASGTSAPTDITDVEPARQIELVYAFDVLFTEPLTEITDRVREETGIDVRLVLAGEGYEEADQRVQADIAAGNPPALAMVGLNRVRPYVEAGRTVPVAPFFDATPEFPRDQFDAEYLELMTFDGELHGLPYVVSTPILYYNADLFQRAGLDPADPPSTWEEVEATSRAIVDAGVARYGANWTWDITGNWLFQAMVESNGGSMLTEDQSATAFAGPAGTGAVEYLTGLVDAGLMPLVDEPAAREAFLRQDLAMLVTSTAYLGAAERGASFDLRTAKMPVPADGERRTPGGGNGFVILAEDPAEQAAAWVVLQALTGVEGCTTTIEATGYMPVNRVAAESPDHLAPLLSEPNRAPTLEQVETLVPWTNFPGTRGREITDIVKAALFAAMSGEATPEAALQQAADEADPLLP